MKESLSSVDNRVVFRQTFNSFESISDKNGTAVSVSINNGVATFDGTNSYISYAPNASGVVSVRIKFKSLTPVTNRYIFDNKSNTFWCYFPSTTSFNSISGTRYVNGILTNTVGTDTKEIIVAGITKLSTSNNTGFQLMCDYVNGSRATGQIELVEIYNGTLTAIEVSELYKGTLYKAPNLDAYTVLDIDPNRGNFEDKKGHTVTNTAVSLVRSSRCLLGSYNGTTSNLSIASANDLSFTAGGGIDLPFSIEFYLNWLKTPIGVGNTSVTLFSKGVAYSSYIIELSKYNGISIRLCNNGSNLIGVCRIDFLDMSKKNNHIVITYNSSKLYTGLKIYINGIYSNNLNVSGGVYTGLAANSNPLTIMKESTLFATGLLGKTKFYSKELSQTEITRLYNSQKGLYQ